MAIRVVLTAQGETALKELMAKVKNHNPILNRFQNNLVSQALVDLNDGLTEPKLRGLAENLMSIQIKRKMLIERLETVSRELDEKAFSSLESGVKKVCNQFDKKDTGVGEK